RWMLSGPELARLLQQFEGEYIQDDDPENPLNFQNHEAGRSTQKTFQRQVNNLTDVVRRMGNPFLDDFQELVRLDSRDCLDASVANAIRTLDNLGKQQYQNFLKDVIEERKKSIHDPIKRNNLALFRKPHSKATSKQGKKIAVLQNNVALFGQLYIAMQSRDGDPIEFFAHEIQSFPPSLSEFGNLRLPSSKADLLKCLAQPGQPEPPKTFDCKVLDGAVIVHCLPTSCATTFDDYADKVFIPYLLQQLQDIPRLDVVWDRYIPDSLKASTRDKRGKGTRRKVAGQTKLPKNWMEFLRDSENKKELFAFLSSKVAHFSWPAEKNCLHYIR
ncbi:hypothetical protein QZH41_006348, partial [Actinostola sp. cb2023]